MATLTRVWVANKSWHLSETWMCSQAETQSNSGPLKANTSLSLSAPRAYRGWCQRCRHWTEKASSLGDCVIRILSESATLYSSTAYICANGNLALWLRCLECEMYVTAWAKGLRRNVTGLKLFLLFLSFYLFMPSGWTLSPKICFSIKWLFIKLCIMCAWTEVAFVSVKFPSLIWFVGWSILNYTSTIWKKKMLLISRAWRWYISDNRSDSSIVTKPLSPTNKWI